ncbi:hypothetical protein UNDKW_1974 [Undibacterium sp. KW1]|uniref:hypothetical protein n=1 Tax=Undibacterium TaxID=401469 RepID=UPI001331DBEA|nr:hypothetical protein [Undibacterium sp. KW1]BBB60247.1 hypothetical protein UNDKW_1974 [Undibacterium sp. KW1]
MSDTDIIQKIAAAVVAQIKPAIPLSIDLWDISTIAQFLKRNESVVRERIACKPDFPPAIRLPTETGKRGHPLYKAKDVIQWAEKYTERRA